MRTRFIAITGGIGSGKSTLSAIIKELGFTVISADETYSELLSDSDFVKGVHLSVGINSDSKTLLREEVSSLVFDDAEKLKALNGYTHKKIVEKMFEKCEGLDVAFHEVPLLFEGGFEKLYDKVVIVTRPIAERVKAVMKRSGLSEEEVLKRIKNQNSYENLSDNKHTVIMNDGEKDDLARKLKAVINEIIG